MIHITPKTLHTTVSHQIIIANCSEVKGDLEAFGKTFQFIFLDLYFQIYIFRFIFLDLYFIYLSLAVCCYNNEIYIFYFFIYSSLTVCCYNNEIKYAARVRVIFGKGVWMRYYFGTTLLVTIQISYTQKWASGSDGMIHLKWTV